MPTAERLVVCAATGASRGVEAAAAAVAVAATAPEDTDGGTLILDLREPVRAPRGTLLASAVARRLERACAAHPGLRGASRGRLCFAAPSSPVEPAAFLEELLDEPLGAGLVLCLCAARDFRAVLDAGRAVERSALLRAAPRADRSLLALLTGELRELCVPLKVWSASIGALPARRALAGIEPGGASGRRAARFAAALVPERGRDPGARFRAALASERGQALPAMLGIAVVVVAMAAILAAFGGAATAKGRMQRSADLAAISAARSMRDDFSRLFVPARLGDGSPNPAHLSKAEYLKRARATGVDAAERNGVPATTVRVSFPDGYSFAPVRVEVGIRPAFETAGEQRGETSAAARAEITPPSTPTGEQPATGTGGGYAGPLAYRQGEGMRPDVAAAFDRLAAAASRDGVALVINSGYRSDSEQQRLWEQNPDPRMVAPPGTSLHRCGTELDLGPPASYAWLAANASRFGFVQRYSWEPWHYGFDAGPEPCSAEGDSAASRGDADGRASGSGGLPAFVPQRFRDALLEAASRHGVSAALLAAQIMAESNFNPAAVSPAGAQGISQFMPETAAAYGLDDPFDPEEAIDAQARMMAELLARFGSIELALAAYNAGPGAVAACSCVPPYPETQAYVARILGLMDGAGALGAAPPQLEVRLVE